MPKAAAKAPLKTKQLGVVAATTNGGIGVNVNLWEEGKLVVDFRRFYVKDGSQLPTGKGFSLDREHLEELRVLVVKAQEFFARRDARKGEKP